MDGSVAHGTVVGGNLVVEGILGKGGMAEVYQVRDVADGTRHALKVMSLGDANERRRLIQEGELQRSIDSPHVVSIRGEMRVGGRPALLMELIRGPTLSAFLRHRELKQHEAMAVFRGICMGVGAAHAKGLIHRDLKPQNVLLDVVDGRLVPKVTDFGVAKDLSVNSELTAENVAIGTPRFMAPEQLDDTATVDRRADMWSLGCILYRLVCGQHAFPGKEGLLLRVTLARYDDPRTHNRRLDEEVLFAIDEMLCRDVTERLPDVPTLFGMLEGRTALQRNDALGSIPTRVAMPKTAKPTTLPVEALPEGLREAMEERRAWERSVGSSVPLASQPPPSPPAWAAADSLLPRTMTPKPRDRHGWKVAAPSVPPGLDGSLSPPADLPARSPEPAPVARGPIIDPLTMLAIGVGIGAVGTLLLASMALGAWTAVYGLPL